MDGLVEIPSPCTSSFLSNNGETTTYACDAPSAGTGIKIVLPGTGKRLSLCEVQVHGRELEFMDNEGTRLKQYRQKNRCNLLQKT